MSTTIINLRGEKVFLHLEKSMESKGKNNDKYVIQLGNESFLGLIEILFSHRESLPLLGYNRLLVICIYFKQINIKLIYIHFSFD